MKIKNIVLYTPYKNLIPFGVSVLGNESGFFRKHPFNKDTVDAICFCNSDKNDLFDLISDVFSKFHYIRPDFHQSEDFLTNLELMYEIKNEKILLNINDGIFNLYIWDNVKLEFVKFVDFDNFLKYKPSLIVLDVNDFSSLSKLSPMNDYLIFIDNPEKHISLTDCYDFISNLNDILTNKNLKYDIIMATDSPIIISDCHGYNVFICNNTVKRVKKETFGVSYELVLDIITDSSVFKDKKGKIACIRQEKIYNEIDNIETRAEWLLQSEFFLKQIGMFGESMNKLYLLKKFSEKAESFK